MGPLIAAQLMASTAFLVVATLHLFVWVRRRDGLEHLLLALTMAFASANAVAEAIFYQAETIEVFTEAFRWANAFSPAMLVSATAFIAVRMKRWAARRQAILGLSAIFVIATGLNFWMPYGFVYTEITALRPLQLPWGETISLASGQSNPWRVMTDLGFVGIIAVVSESTLHWYRAGHHRDAVYLGGSMLLYLLLILGAGIVVDLGLLPIPYLFTWGYLVFGIVLSGYLAGDIVRTATLSAEVRANEARWRSLLEQVKLLVATADPQGRFDYVNPFFSQTTGYGKDDLTGRPVVELLPSEIRPEATQTMSAASATGALGEHEGPIVTKDGRTRWVSWSTVILQDVQGSVTGLLGIGADVTTRHEAEQSRDRALEDARAALEEVERLKSRLQEQVVYLQDEISMTGRFADVVGESDALNYVLNKVEQIAGLDTTVLLLGETGAGKELFARTIHNNSRRQTHPLIKVNCAALPSELVEAELFGHEKGSFTGADRRHRGRFELANHGTLLLDEVGELPPEAQSKLLGVLEDGSFDRVGGEETLTVDVRVIAATNRDLQAEVDAGRFRSDLYYRLNVFPITVPTLRDRKTDIPALVNLYIDRFSRAQGKQISQVPRPVMDELMDYDWPGNVRELASVVERAVVTSPGPQLRLADRLVSRPTQTPGDYQGDLETVERKYITRVLELTSWRIEGTRGAAELLGLHPNTLRSRMGKLGIKRPGK